MKPIIDVHTHIFRGRDIPLKGCLLSRRYEEWYIRLLAPLLFSVIAKCVRREKLATEKTGPVCGLVQNLVYKYMGPGYRRWADILSLTEVADVARELINTYEKDGIALYIPLMIDYEYWFKSPQEPSIASQIEAIYQHVVLPQEGKVHPFVSFDPAREQAYRKEMLGPTGQPEEYSSLGLVKDAIRNRGFIGVKVYNTLGYRPLGNEEVDKQRKQIFERNGMGRYSVFTGQEFDDVLTELYEFCVEEQVPITAHCVWNGIEAYPGASFDFGSPKYWRPVLDKFPDLHLNLAHFGWSYPDEYFSEVPQIVQSLFKLRQALGGQSWEAQVENKKPWVREICEMLGTYKYLFTDVAHHGVTDDKDIPKFKAAYQKMRKDFGDLIPERLLFGIDWHVIARVDNYTGFKDRYIHRVLNDIFTDEEMADFLGGNTLRFLGLLPLETKPQDGWTENRKRLKDFYERNDIEPPDWFTSTA